MCSTLIELLVKNRRHLLSKATFVGCSTKEVTYAPCWADTSNFREIRMSNHFLNDHEPAMVLRALETMAEDFGLDSPYNECNV